MRQALENLIEVVEAAIKAGDWKVDGACDPTMALIRAKRALARENQEPVAWRFPSGTRFNREVHWRYIDTLEGTEGLLGLQPLYTAPLEWVDLTDDEMLMIYGQKHEGKKYNLGRMVQQALKEKNNG